MVWNTLFGPVTNSALFNPPVDLWLKNDLGKILTAEKKPK